MAVTVAKAASTARGTSSIDDNAMSERQRQSARDTASTSGRASHAEDVVDLRRGRNGTYRADEKSRRREQSPDASWSFAFASPTTKSRAARARPGNDHVSAPGQSHTAASYCCPTNLAGALLDVLHASVNDGYSQTTVVIRLLDRQSLHMPLL